MSTEQHAQGGETGAPATLTLTAHAEFLDSALQELKRLENRLRDIEVLAPGIALCRVPDLPKFQRSIAEARPTFVRHLAPVQTGPFCPSIRHAKQPLPGEGLSKSQKR